MRLLIGCLGLAVVLIGLDTSVRIARADDSARNAPARWNLVEGRCYSYDLSRTVQGKSTAGPCRIVLKASLAETPGKVPDAGPIPVTCTVTALSLEWEQGKVKFTYDSRKKPKIPADNTVLVAYAALAGKSFEVQVHRTGEVAGVTGIEAALGNEGAGPDGQAVAASIRSLLDFQFQCVCPQETEPKTWDLSFPFPLNLVLPGQADLQESVHFSGGGRSNEKGFPSRVVTTKSEFVVPDIGGFLAVAGGGGEGRAGAAGTGGGGMGMSTGGGPTKAPKPPKVENSGTGKITFADAGVVVKSQRKTSLNASQDKASISWSVEHTAELTNKPDAPTGGAGERK